ncbi:10267_t:CDS:1, partial [Gigaspora margarita]
MSFFKKIVNKFNKRNTFTSEETYVETWKEESKFKKFFKKLFKRAEEKEVVNQYWDDIDYIESSYSTSNKEDSDVSTLLLTEEENPIVFDKFETSEYKIFISYDKFKEYLLDENIINVGATYRSKEKRLKGILDFCEAHIRSYFNLFNDGYGYSVQYNILDLNYYRRKSYENDFKVWFHE